MQAFGKRNVTVTATRINATVTTTNINATVTATNINATVTVKRNATIATTLTSKPSSEVASSEIVSSEMVAPLEKITTGLASGEITRLTLYE